MKTCLCLCFSKIFFFPGNQDDSKNSKWNLFKNHPIFTCYLLLAFCLRNFLCPINCLFTCSQAMLALSVMYSLIYESIKTVLTQRAQIDSFNHTFKILWRVFLLVFPLENCLQSLQKWFTSFEICEQHFTDGSNCGMKAFRIDALRTCLLGHRLS